MNNIYIKAEEIPTELIEKYFNNKDLVTIDQLICALDDANFDLKKLEEEFGVQADAFAFPFGSMYACSDQNICCDVCTFSNLGKRHRAYLCLLRKLCLFQASLNENYP